MRGGEKKFLRVLNSSFVASSCVFSVEPGTRHLCCISELVTRRRLAGVRRLFWGTICWGVGASPWGNSARRWPKLYPSSHHTCVVFILTSCAVDHYFFLLLSVIWSDTTMKTPLLCVLCSLVVLSVSSTAEQKLKNCNEVRAAYSSKGFNVNDVPNKGVNGEFYILLSGQFPISITVVHSRGSQIGGRGPLCGSWMSVPGVLRLMITFKLAKLA